MNTISFTKADVINKHNIRIQTNISLLDISQPLLVKSDITNKVVEFKYDRDISAEQTMLNEGWDGEEWHIYYTDTENKNIVLNLWDSPNFHY